MSVPLREPTPRLRFRKTTELGTHFRKGVTHDFYQVWNITLFSRWRISIRRKKWNLPRVPQKRTVLAKEYAEAPQGYPLFYHGEKIISAVETPGFGVVILHGEAGNMYEVTWNTLLVTEDEDENAS